MSLIASSGVRTQYCLVGVRAQYCVCTIVRVECDLDRSKNDDPVEFDGKVRAIVVPRSDSVFGSELACDSAESGYALYAGCLRKESLLVPAMTDVARDVGAAMSRIVSSEMQHSYARIPLGRFFDRDHGIAFCVADVFSEQVRASFGDGLDSGWLSGNRQSEPSLQRPK